MNAAGTGGVAQTQWRDHHRVYWLEETERMRLQLAIVVILGLHGRLTALEVAQYLYAYRTDDDLPLATVELAMLDLCKSALLRRVWIARPRKFRLSRHGRLLHQDLIEANEAQALQFAG